MIIGISGKSGSGKSKIAEDLAKELGANVINFDRISHLAIQTDTFKELVKTKISTNVFDNNGNIMRKKLGEVVFNDKEKLNLINTCSEKIMCEIIDKLIEENKLPYIILEYSLLHLMKYFNMCDFKILVTAKESIRCERVMNRDGISEEYFALREKNSPNYIPSLFNTVIENNTNDDYGLNFLVKTIKQKENLC